VGEKCNASGFDLPAALLNGLFERPARGKHIGMGRRFNARALVFAGAGERSIRVHLNYYFPSSDGLDQRMLGEHSWFGRQL
jgi:hypothetical protein